MSRHEPNPDAAVVAAIRGLLEAVGWTQRELARRAGVSQSFVSDVLCGRVGRLSIARADQLVRVMGGRLTIGVDAPYLAGGRRQADAAHALMAARVASRLRRRGWLVVHEVEVGGDRSRGWIDLLAIYPGSGLLLVIELKTEIHDLGRMQRTLGWYERESFAAARRLGWRPTRTLGVVLVLATRENDARISAHRAIFDAEFPVRARHLNLTVAVGSAPAIDGRGIAAIDPRSHRQRWCLPLRTDGRRTAAPYADYAAFMRATLRPGG